jgi:hypothetical protein
MLKPKYKLGDKVKYVGGMMRYNAKSGVVISVHSELSGELQQKQCHYYRTSFTVDSHGSCSESEIKINKEK